MLTSLSPQQVEERATTFFSTLGYSKEVDKENPTRLIFKDGKNINWVIFLILFVVIAILGAIIYWLICDNHEVILTITPHGDLSEVTTSANSTDSSVESSNFLLQLPQKN